MDEPERREPFQQRGTKNPLHRAMPRSRPRTVGPSRRGLKRQRRPVPMTPRRRPSKGRGPRGWRRGHGQVAAHAAAAAQRPPPRRRGQVKRPARLRSQSAAARDAAARNLQGRRPAGSSSAAQDADPASRADAGQAPPGGDGDADCRAQARARDSSARRRSGRWSGEAAPEGHRLGHAPGEQADRPRTSPALNRLMREPLSPDEAVALVVPARPPAEQRTGSAARGARAQLGESM